MTPAATSIPINENSSKEVYIRTSPSFNSSLGNLTKENKAKIADVMHWLDKGIKSKGLNLEKLSGESAPFMSCRLSQDLRLILTHPTENVYIFYYAGRHDDAYTWAERHNAGLDQWGNIQCYPVPIGSKATVPNKETKTTFTSSKHKSLFEKFTNQQLLSLSVPPELLQAVRNVYTKKDLERLAVKYLPLNAHQNLIALADGITYDQILKEITSVKPAKTWEEAVQRPQVDLWTYDEKEFEKILAEPIAKWRIFLHPDQARLVTSPSRAPMLVKGAAGTGKTVAALHRAAYLVKDPGWDPSKKLLFTTFTTTLAQDIRENLKGLCTPEELERIEVNHFNNWLAEFLKSHGVEEEIVYDSKKPQGRHSFSWRKRWIEALKHNKHPGINNKFLKDEWNNYIIREGIFTEQQYLKAERKGSQKPLDKKDRRLIWPVFDTMRKLLKKANVMAFDEACVRAMDILKKNPNDRPYEAVVVDEVQDLDLDALKILAEVATSPTNGGTKSKKPEPYIFLAGDPHQRLYVPSHVLLKEAGINVEGERTKILKVAYRTSGQIHQCARSFLADEIYDDVDEEETFKGLTSLRAGELPEVKEFETFKDEISWIERKIKDLHMGPEEVEYESICIVGRTGDAVKKYEDAFKELGYSVKRLGNERIDKAEYQGIRFATMHRVKGLEFKAIFLVSDWNATKDTYWALQSEDRTIAENNFLQERAVLYVASSRARDHLYITWHDKNDLLKEEVESYVNEIRK